jgi:hypothetical protein
MHLRFAGTATGTSWLRLPPFCVRNHPYRQRVDARRRREQQGTAIAVTFSSERLRESMRASLALIALGLERYCQEGHEHG